MNLMCEKVLKPPFLVKIKLVLCCLVFWCFVDFIGIDFRKGLRELKQDTAYFIREETIQNDQLTSQQVSKYHNETAESLETHNSSHVFNNLTGFSWVRKFELSSDSKNVEQSGPDGIECTLPIDLTKTVLYDGEDTENKFRSLPTSFQKYLTVPQPQANCGFDNLLIPSRHLNNQTIDMIFLVKSDPQHFLGRKLIRNTWAFIKSIRGMTFATIFLVGTTNSSEKQSSLKAENERFGDLLQCNVTDTYRALPLKMLAGFGWILKTGVRANLVTVTDDDCVMNVLDINTWYRETLIEPFDLFCGLRFNPTGKPIRWTQSKWYIRTQVYSGKFYPRFCQGRMYILPLPLMRDLYCMSEVTHKGDFHLEDVYITGILREKSGHPSIKHVTRNGRDLPFTYHADNENKTVYEEMIFKWKIWNASLPWADTEKDTGLPTIMTYAGAEQN
ncbi:beta-1,3-galactosyltransferase 5-like [Clavelina lepadiformis]|uniref:beta-1,3-galactosyltransferase 5-like n=1 Tax=Clavelina lepadiformis TaxID=159417 RepID=UPI00404366F2